MNYIKIPYLPQDETKLYIGNCSISGAKVILPPVIDALPDALKQHADLGICVINENTCVCAPETFEYYKNALYEYGFTIHCGFSHLESNYPKDCAYNIGIVGNKCFLNFKVCDKVLKDILILTGYELIDVRQGYSKCSLCPVNEHTLITGDNSIKKAALMHGLDTIFVPNDDIILQGYNNGFIGGCIGMKDKNTLLINGELSFIKNAEFLINSLKALDIRIESIKKGAVTDIGSIIPLMTT